MIPLSRRLLLVAVIAAQSCVGGLTCFSSSPIPCSGSGGAYFGGPSEVAPEPLNFAGQALSSKFSLQGSVDCSGSSTTDVTSITLEVFDPDNRRVDANATAPTKGTDPYAYGVNTWDTTVTFTPSRTGSYHVIVTFEPGVGIVQKDLWVVEDHGADMPIKLQVPSAQCAHLERTTLGTVVCQLRYEGVKLFRDGAEIANWPFGTAHVAGNVIWTLGSSDGLTRSLDTGTGPPQSTATLRGLTATGAFAVNENEALLWDSGSIKLVRFAGGALTTVSDIVPPETYAVSALAFSSTAGSALYAESNRWTRLTLSPGHTEQTPTWTEDEVPGYQADDGLWIALDAGAFRFVPADPSRSTLSLTAPTGWQGSLEKTIVLLPGTRPVLFAKKGSVYTDTTPTLLTNEALVPVATGADLRLLRFVAPANAAFVEVTGNTLRAERGDEQFFYALP